MSDLAESSQVSSAGAFSKSRRKKTVLRLGRWVWSMGLTLAGLLLITFLLAQASPVDPVLRVAGDHASEETLRQVRHDLGLDVSLPEQFIAYVGKVVKGDFGVSYSTGQPVADDLARAFPATIELATLSILLGASIGVSLGLVSVLRPGGVIDGLVRFLSLLGFSVPIFWLGLLMLLIFYATLQWTGGPGRLDDLYLYTVESKTGFGLIDAWLSGEEGAFANAVSHLILPTVALAFYTLGGICRLTRVAALDELAKEYVVTARAKGATDARILFLHVLPNIAGTLITVIALAYAGLLEGAVLTETVFAWPGIGRYLTTAMFASDFPAVLGGTLTIGACFIIVNSLTDLLVQLLDPRAR